jgi:hypothetical protein
MRTGTNSPRFWLLWVVAFLSFPVAGLLANLVGSATTPLVALLAGAISGATLGLAQWLILRSRLSLPIWWIAATSVGMAVGMAVSTVFLGSETAGSPLLWRGLITGACMGLAQWLFLRPIVPQSIIWIAVVAVGWAIGWAVTRSAGIDLTPKWGVFGVSGAFTFQLLTGLALYYLLRRPQAVK